MKRLITCSDGTWNQPGEKDRKVEANTNVYKIYQCISSADESGMQQKKFYDPGVGTAPGPIDKIWGGISGAGIDQNIKDVYTFLANNYKQGDEIYLFGFSRGAYTARSSAGMIRNCGILRKEYLNKIDEAFELYRERGDDSHPNSEKSINFKKNFSYEPRIKFIGVWDTVGSLGIPLPWLHAVNSQRYKFHDTTLSSWVDNAYHALAIDERRKLFEPTLWNKSSSLKDHPDHLQKIEQRWFIGVHSNVGGGYADCGLSDLALQWLIDKAQEVGLIFESDELHKIKGNYMGVLRNSYTWEYWFWPKIWRKITLHGNDNQYIHDSVWKRYEEDKSYRPGNLIQISKN